MHACTQQFVDRTSASARLFDSFVNLDSCVEDGFSSSLELGYVVLGLFFSLPQLAFDLTSTPTIPDSCRQRSSISLTAVPRNHVEHVSFEHSVSFPRAVITSRREKKQQQGQSFSAPNRQSVRFMLPHQPARAVCTCCRSSAAVQRVS